MSTSVVVAAPDLKTCAGVKIDENMESDGVAVVFGDGQGSVIHIT
jgi:hypothetical protein